MIIMGTVADQKRIKNLRKQMYFDSMVGVISAIIALTSIIYVTLNIENFSPNLVFYIVSTSFWIAFLCFSIIFLALGIYSGYRAKHWDESKQRKNLKPPRIG